MANKKVLLIRNVAPKEYGGAEVYQIRLARELKANGFLPVIVSSSRKLLDEAKGCGFDAIKAPFLTRQNWSGKYNLLLPVYFYKLRGLQKWHEALFLKEKPDVINVQSRDDLIAATKAAKKCGVRVIWTDHADFRNWMLINIHQRFKNVIGKRILKCMKDVYKIVMISEVEKEWFLKNVCETDKLEVVQNGVKDGYSKYKNVKAKKRSFCFVGRVVKEKGISELVKAFSKVKAKYSDASLVICGGGKDEEGRLELRKICGEASLDGIEMVGRVDDVLPILAKAETFVLPSYKEGMSLALIEAMMMKKTIIATRVGAAREMLGEDGGILVKAGDALALENAMKIVLEVPEEAKKMGVAARTRYKEFYDTDEIFAKKMLPLYNIGKEK